MVIEFIIVGFNRESDVTKGRFRVVLNEKAPWLIWAVLIPTCLEHYNITIEELRLPYKRRKYKGKPIDFHKVLTEEPMDRWHRRIIASSKAVKLKLKNDRVIVEAAHHWYQSRVVYPSIEKYCVGLSIKTMKLDGKNIQRWTRKSLLDKFALAMMLSGI